MEPDRTTLEGMAKRLLDRTLTTTGGTLVAALRGALVELVVESVQLGMQFERRHPPEAVSLSPALRKDLVREDALDRWCAHSSCEGDAWAIADSREACREAMIKFVEERDAEGYDAATRVVDRDLDHGDVFITRCAVRVAWVNDGDERAPTPAWLDTVPA